MKQVVIIHGGSSFASHADYIQHMADLTLDYERLKYKKQWKSWIAEQLTDHDILLPTFPNAANAQFEEWKNYFEKILPLLEDDVQLVGHSLGAMFLSKYLQQYPLKKPVRRIILVAGRYNNEPRDVGSFDIHDTSDLTKSTKEIHLFHSQDDQVVPFADMAKFEHDLPNATTHIFQDRGHFNDTTFPELLELLKQK